jgi:hypothetical protein
VLHGGRIGADIRAKEFRPPIGAFSYLRRRGTVGNGVSLDDSLLELINAQCQRRRGLPECVAGSSGSRIDFSYRNREMTRRRAASR